MKRGDIKTNRIISSKPSQNKTFKELGEEFLRNAEVRGLSEWTIKSHRYQIGYLLEFAGNNLMCKDISLDLVVDYIFYMKEKKGITNTVILNSYLQNTSPIIKYGINKRYILNDFKIPFIKGQETFKEIYSERLQLMKRKIKSQEDCLLVQAYMMYLLNTLKLDVVMMKIIYSLLYTMRFWQ